MSFKLKPPGYQVAAHVTTLALRFLFTSFDSLRELLWSFGRCFQCFGVSSSPSCTTPSRLGPSHHTILQLSAFLPSFPSLSVFTFIFFLLFSSILYQLLSFSGSIL